MWGWVTAIVDKEGEERSVGNELKIVVHEQEIRKFSTWIMINTVWPLFHSEILAAKHKILTYKNKKWIYSSSGQLLWEDGTGELVYPMRIHRYYSTWKLSGMLESYHCDTILSASVFLREVLFVFWNQCILYQCFPVNLSIRKFLYKPACPRPLQNPVFFTSFFESYVWYLFIRIRYNYTILPKFSILFISLIYIITRNRSVFLTVFL